MEINELLSTTVFFFVKDSQMDQSIGFLKLMVKGKLTSNTAFSNGTSLSIRKEE